MTSELVAWAALIGLGLFHGVNPAMGWLFAVALGLQERSRAAVARALVPITLGHAAAVLAVVGVLALARMAVDLALVQGAAAVVLLAFGLYRAIRGYRHKWRADMRAGFAELALWSFFMAMAHGAGLMVAPVVLMSPSAAAGHAHHDHGAADLTGLVQQPVVAVLVHSAAMLAAAGLIALLIYEWLGLAVLRTAWFNLDLVWSAALIATGLVLLAMQLV